MCKAEVEECFWQGLCDAAVATGVQLVSAPRFSGQSPETTPGVFPDAITGDAHKCQKQIRK